jgi:hypothetical protein
MPQVGLRQRGGQSQPILAGVGMGNATSQTLKCPVTTCWPTGAHRLPHLIHGHWAVSLHSRNATKSRRGRIRTRSCSRAPPPPPQASGLSSDHLLLLSPRFLGSVCAVAAAACSAIRFSGDRPGLLSWRLGVLAGGAGTRRESRIENCNLPSTSLIHGGWRGSSSWIMSTKLISERESMRMPDQIWHHGQAASFLFG